MSQPAWKPVVSQSYSCLNENDWPSLEGKVCTSHLDSLLPELKIEILSQFDSHRDIRRLIDAFPSFHAVYRCSKSRLRKAVKDNSLHETTVVIQEMLARGVDGVNDLLNPRRFQYFDVIIPKAEIRDWTVSAVRELFQLARSGKPIALDARDRDALKEVAAVAGYYMYQGLGPDRDSDDPERRWRARTNLPYGVYDRKKHVWLQVADTDWKLKEF